MLILDRYILKSILVIFLSCVFLFLFLYVVIDLLTNLEDMLKQKLEWFVLIQYYLANMPVMFMQVAPFACLLSTLYTFGSLNHSNEIIAMRASGLSVFQITKTAIIFGLLVSMFIFWLNDRVIPPAAVTSQKIREQLTQGKKIKDKKDDIINLSMYGLRNRLFFINKFSPSTNTMEGITILEQDEHQNLIKKIVAFKGVYSLGLWKFYNCTTFNFDINGQIKEEPQYFDEEIMVIPETPRDFLNQRQRPDYMTISQINDYIWRLSRSGASTVIRNLKIDLYQRFAVPLTSLVIVVLGIPFSMTMKRRATGLSSIGISILVGFLYYVLSAVGLALGKAGILPPFLAASSSHIITFIFSFYLISTSR